MFLIAKNKRSFKKIWSFKHVSMTTLFVCFYLRSGHFKKCEHYQCFGQLLFLSLQNVLEQVNIDVKSVLILRTLAQEFCSTELGKLRSDRLQNNIFVGCSVPSGSYNNETVAQLFDSFYCGSADDMDNSTSATVNKKIVIINIQFFRRLRYQPKTACSAGLVYA